MTWITACKEALHPALAPAYDRKPRILACAIYSRIYSARNDYLHGNPVSDVQLIVHPYKRFLLDYAPVLYRMALTAFLDLKFKEPEPSREQINTYLEWQGRWFEYTKYQRDMESALATIHMTPEQQAKRDGRIL